MSRSVFVMDDKNQGYAAAKNGKVDSKRESLQYWEGVLEYTMRNNEEPEPVSLREQINMLRYAQRMAATIQTGNGGRRVQCPMPAYLAAEFSTNVLHTLEEYPN